VQNVAAGDLAEIAFTVLESDLQTALTAVEKAAAQLNGAKVTHDANVSKVSIVGLGMATQAGVADRMFRALAEANINILAITTSRIKVSVLVSRALALEALRAVHGEFELEKPPGDRSEFGAQPVKLERPSAVDIVARLQRMEDLTIEKVKLDSSQARVTITQVPDKPGIAAAVFEAVAAEGIMVDMIVQGTGHDGAANLSFTVPHESLRSALETAGRAATELGCGQVTHDPRIAILTVLGIGIRTHTGVGVRMFNALSKAGINVDMISTSEVRVNVVVAADKGEAGLAALQEAFADVLG
jgi:aspartate kinase